MAYVLGGVEIRNPMGVSEKKIERFSQVQTLDGRIHRDYYNSLVGTKHIWTLEYENATAAEYSAIKTIYDTYKNTDTVQTWEVTESNFTVAETNVHIDLIERKFSTPGTDYLASFQLILTES
jgi:hypothetical protein